MSSLGLRHIRKPPDNLTTSREAGNESHASPTKFYFPLYVGNCRPIQRPKNRHEPPSQKDRPFILSLALLVIGLRFDMPSIHVPAEWKRELNLPIQMRRVNGEQQAVKRQQNQFIGPLKPVVRTRQEEIQLWVSSILGRTAVQRPILLSKIHAQLRS
jgi:hypothetical protein